MSGRESAETVSNRQKRWRRRNREASRRIRARQKLRYYRQFQRNNGRKKKLWTPAEEARITAKDRPTDRKLSRALGRSVQAIQQQRSRLRTAKEARDL